MLFLIFRFMFDPVATCVWPMPAIIGCISCLTFDLSLVYDFFLTICQPVPMQQDASEFAQLFFTSTAENENGSSQACSEVRLYTIFLCTTVIFSWKNLIVL